MEAKIEVSERISSLGQQVFVFELPNGRRLELEFCAGMADPTGGVCCAVGSLYEHDGEKITILVNDSAAIPDDESDEWRKPMRRPCLWFSTDEEEESHGQVLKAELDEIKEQLGPLVKELDSFKTN